MTFDAMTTSPVESVNNHIKHNAGVRSNVLKLLIIFPLLLLQYVSVPSIGIGQI